MNILAIVLTIPLIVWEARLDFMEGPAFTETTRERCYRRMMRFVQLRETAGLPEGNWIGTCVPVVEVRL